MNYYTVVVADDEDELREATCQMIDWEAIGYRLVGSAGNGLDALQLVEQLQPDLLLTDIRMPFISGMELARQVREIRPLTHIAFLSGYDDFEYAQQAIAYNVVSYMLKPIGAADLTRELSTIHKKIERQYRTFSAPEKQSRDWTGFLSTLLLDEFTEEQELMASEQALLQEAASCGVIQSVQTPLSMVVVVTEFRDGEQQNCTTQEQTRPVDLLLEKYYRAFSIYAGRRVLTLLLAGETGFSALSINLEELRQAVRRVTGLRCAIGVSRPISAFWGCHRACREAMDALRFAPDGNGIHEISDVFAASRASDKDLGELLSQLDSLLRSGTRAELGKLVSQLFACAGDDWEMAALQVMAAVFRMMLSAGSGDQIAVLRRRFNLSDSILRDCDPAELQHNMTELALSARELISQQRKDGVSLLCEQALSIINQSYMEESLSLGGVSEQLHVSPNYLSANMKKYAGDTFMNLLIKKRMEVAGDLLSATNLKILEIAQRCGYSDQHYFSFCFKKYHGVSPITLRRQRQEGPT